MAVNAMNYTVISCFCSWFVVAADHRTEGLVMLIVREDGVAKVYTVHFPWDVWHTVWFVVFIGSHVVKAGMKREGDREGKMVSLRHLEGTPIRREFFFRGKIRTKNHAKQSINEQRASEFVLE